jgi:cytochrome c5
MHKNLESTVYLIKRTILSTTFALSLIGTTSFAQEVSFTEDAIAERIAPVGDVYLDGEIATANRQTDSDSAAAPRSAEKIYNTYCIACHASGAAGAPIKGDAQQWQPRIAQGQDVLVNHAINGFNAMPARGTCSDCSDDEIAATVKFLTEGL